MTEKTMEAPLLDVTTPPAQLEQDLAADAVRFDFVKFPGAPVRLTLRWDPETN